MTLDASSKPLPLGDKACRNNHQCLVGAFHGHAHNRLCQSRFLEMYVEGLGLEDLKGCERFSLKQMHWQVPPVTPAPFIEGGP
jgi:Kyakuja-Dileera-Zisupton transposase